MGYNFREFFETFFKQSVDFVLGVVRTFAVEFFSVLIDSFMGILSGQFADIQGTVISVYLIPALN